MRKELLSLALFSPYFLISQNLTGIVYDDDNTIKGAKVENINQKKLTYTNDRGEFEIIANFNDTLEISSYFHETQKIIIGKSNFNEKVVIELKPKLNELDEVRLREEREKKFNATQTQASTGEQLANDIKNNPQLYNTYLNYGVDFVYLGKLIGKLLNKNKYKAPAIKPITFHQLDSLFSRDKILNYSYISQNLEITEDQLGLFVDYCTAKNYNDELLKVENRLIFIDSIFKASREFNKLLVRGNKN